MKLGPPRAPLRHLKVEGTLIRRQPPVVGWGCRLQFTKEAVRGVQPACQAGASGCHGTPEPCPVCQVLACQIHEGRHARRFKAPVDAWLKAVRYAPAKTPESGLAVIQWCRPPTSSNAGKACVMPAKTCKGNPAPCPWCGWSFCEHHRRVHIQTVELGSDYWQRVLDRLERGLKRAAKLGRGRGQIRLTDRPPKGWTEADSP